MSDSSGSSVPGIPKTMRALQQTSLRGPHDLTLVTDAPVPSPGPGEILLVFAHQVQVIGLNIGVLIQRAPAVFGQIVGELSALIGSGVIAPADPTSHALADGPKALIDLENRATSGKLVLLPGQANQASGKPA